MRAFPAKLRTTAPLLLTLLVAIGCSQDAPLPPAPFGTPGGPQLNPPGLVEADAQSGATVTNATDLPLQAGVFYIADSDDVVLANDRVAVTIRDGSGGAAMYGSTAGHLVDAVRRDAGPKRDALREIVIAVGMHVVKPTGFQSNAFEGGVSLIVHGELVAFPTLSEALGLQKPDVTVTHTYTLPDNSNVLEIATTITASQPTTDPILVADALFWSGDVQLFLPGHGTDNLPNSLQTDEFAVTPVAPDLDVPAYAFVAEKKLSMINAGGILGFLHTGVVPSQSGTTIRRWLAIGGSSRHDVDSALTQARMQRSQPLTGAPLSPPPYTSFAVPESLPDAMVFALNAAGKPLTMCSAFHPVGNTSWNLLGCRLPEGTASVVPGWIGNGDGMAGGVGQLAKALAFATPLAPKTLVPVAMRGKIRVLATHNGATLAFRVTFVGADGEKRTWVNAAGTATFQLPPGKYDVWVHHGPHWSQHHETIQVAGDKTLDITAKLQPVVDTGDWVSADFHVHSEGSSDSAVRSRHRLEGAVAEGVHYMVATDHDRLTDLATRLGAGSVDLTGKLLTAIGVEVSTIKHGHFNVWPLKRELNDAGFGAPPWAEMTVSALQSSLLKRATSAGVVQCNHPRFGDASVWSAIDFDRVTTDGKTLKCHALELLNGIAHNDTPEVLLDWLALHKRGVRVTATGTSDCHGNHDFAGNPRTLVRVDGFAGDVAQLKAASIDAALKAGHAIATAGPFVTLTAHTGTSAGDKSARIGETLEAKGQKVTVTARVQSPAWMPLGRLRLLRNGDEVLAIDLSDTKPAAGKHDRTVELSDPATATDDSFWVAVSEPTPVRPTPGVHRPTWAITNPVFVTR